MGVSRARLCTQVITILAKRATSDSTLRVLMEKVRDGKATKAELGRFQGIIDRINEEERQREKKGFDGDSEGQLS